MPMPKVVAGALACLLPILLPILLSPAVAQPGDAAADYPNRTVKFIVSAPPGGGPDIVARLLAEKLQQRWGQPVVVENRPGAGGNLGTGEVAAAEPDGYTLLSLQPGPITSNALLYKKLNFDPTALEPVVLSARLPNVLAVRLDFPANTVQELIAYAKANPGKITYGSQGIGTTPHLTAELFSNRAGVAMTHVPYRGTAQISNDLLAGHLDLLFVQLDAVREHYIAKKVKLLAVTVDRRLPSLPEIPTMAEAGLPDFQSDTWNGIVAPPKTPKPIVDKVNAAINDIFKLPEFRDHLAKLSMQPAGGSPGDMAAFVATERARWSEVIKAAKISAN
jgi:tripartite-type tricarboxylate transporter receptor subunit TctC